MKQPTVEELTNFIFGQLDCGLMDFLPQDKCESLAKKIDRLYNPTLKLLSELHKDEESCRKVFEFVKWGVYKNTEIMDNRIIMIGEYDDSYDTYEVRLAVFYNGSVILAMDGVDEDEGNIFALVDFIRTLGYDVQSETKTP